MSIATCGQCTWEIEILGPQEAADRARDRHIALRHPELVRSTVPAPSASSDWRTRALDALTQLAIDRRTQGRNFTVFEVAEYGIEEPPDPAHDWGSLTRDAKHQDLIEAVKNEDGTPKAVASLRPATKGSLVKVWQAGPAAVRRQPA